MAGAWEKASVRQVGAAIAGLALAPWVPLYLRRSMARASGSGGDFISWGFDVSTLPGFVEAMPYMRPEEGKYLWLAVNLGLFVVLAVGIALAVAAIWRRAGR